MSQPSKRLIVCADGTWVDSEDGYTKPTLIPYNPTGTLQIQSNVTRISRALKRIAHDGKPQIIYYHSGVGTGVSTIDTVTGGLFGKGISENIREVYSFVASNYTPGDEIILIGFSRGAFTVRSVASMVRDIGLLTRAGMDFFYPIFKDQENFRNERYKDIFPEVPFSDKPRGPDAAKEYKRRLLQNDLTRLEDPDGSRIEVHAVAVWDTVGSLGIPSIPFLSRMGLQPASKEYKFYDTSLSGIIRHAFQVLALDEHRGPFSPAVWERKRLDKCTVDLRQVWFPGAHSNVGGGYPDQEIANITLAWMMDQLASIGLSFQENFIEQIFEKTAEDYEHPPPIPKKLTDLFSRAPDEQWAIRPVYEKHRPVRPFGLGKIIESKTGVWNLAGKSIRTPGLYMRVDPNTGVSTGVPMVHTNERIHSCVRIRLELEGLGPDDNGLYKCTALLKNGPWRLRQIRIRVKDPIPWNASWGPDAPPSTNPPNDLRWVWEYDGPEEDAPRESLMIEDNLGPYQRKLLLMNKARSPSKRHHKRRKRRPPSDREDMIDGEPFREKPERRRRHDPVIVDGPDHVHDERRYRYERPESVVVVEKRERDDYRVQDGKRYRHENPESSVIVDERERERNDYRIQDERRRRRHDYDDDIIVVEEERDPYPKRDRKLGRY